MKTQKMDMTHACCGHGTNNEAYIQYYDGIIVSGNKAIDIINSKGAYIENGTSNKCYLPD